MGYLIESEGFARPLSSKRAQTKAILGSSRIVTFLSNRPNKQIAHQEKSKTESVEGVANR